jgi:ribosomal protein S6
MKKYQITYLISTELSEKEVTEISEKIGSFIQEHKGILTQRKKPVAKKLGTQIKTQKTAYVASLNFQLDAENLAALDTFLKKIKNEAKILRYLITNEKTAEEKKSIIRKPFAVKAKETQKVELKEIEKKLNEILE